MFDDDQNPNTLNASFCFEVPGGKRKMMELEVRHWITNHEAEIGAGAYGASGVPARDSAADASKKPATQQSLGPKDAKTNTVGNIFYGIKRLSRRRRIRRLQDLAERQCRTPGHTAKGSGDHYANFVDCIRSRRAQDIHLAD